MSDKSKRLTLAEIKNTQEYSLLTGKQQLFCESYIQGGIDTGTYDPVGSALMSYACKSKENARVMSYSLMANIRIVAVLNRHFNREPIEEFVIQIDRAIQNKKLSIAQLQALKLKGDVLGYTTRLPGTNGQSTDTILAEVASTTKAAKKAARKKPTYSEDIEVPNQFSQH